ncbi:Testis-specific serine/threonine-protein kinase 6-like [Oopsacas minuta]|uniref:Testis-specific serine/threonine-protein kinase 6-like n=1 Tax=Oopsacas minuta TaxID=111878 RepID=A0AAV7K9C3_9METZ|nr:Testis-specific serine/threonine-protein kinase 6-like [Oopsacas minuta]
MFKRNKIPVTRTTSYTRSGRISMSMKLILQKQGYVLEKKLASGAFSKVQVAHSLSNNRSVVVKIIEKSSLEDEIWDQFVPREIDTICRIEHPHIIRTHEILQTEVQIFIVMKVANGGNLSDYVAKKKYLQEYIVHRLFGEITSALKYLHNKLIYHRDLKPENVLLDGNFRSKLADFGFSRKASFSKQKLETYCGSFLFASPEILRNKPYEGATSDIWSLGVILYLMLTGAMPFSEKEIWQIDSDNIPTLIHFPHWPRVSPLAENMVRQLLVFIPETRFKLLEIEDHLWMRKHT